MNETVGGEIAPRHPLQEIRVLDLGQIYNGGYCSFLLAQAGADVVKVEPPEGEPLRARGGGRLPLAFAMLNANKRGIVLDLKTDGGRDLFERLAGEADVMMENFPPGALERLGIDVEALMDRHPRLICASSSGYGLSGPDMDNLAMDLTMQAVGGVMSINGPEDGPPLKAGLAICDFLGAIHFYAGIVTAIAERAVTGRGRRVEVSMQEALYPALASNLTAMQLRGVQPERRGNRHPMRGSAPYNVYACADGHVALICVKEVHWTSLLDAIGKPEAASDPRFATQRLRSKNEADIDALLSPWFQARTRAEIAATLKAARVPAAPVRDLAEVTADPHMHERGMLKDVEHPILGPVTLPGSPLRLHGTAELELKFDPELGEHTGEVLGDWLGLDEVEIAKLQAAGALG